MTDKATRDRLLGRIDERAAELDSIRSELDWYRKALREQSLRALKAEGVLESICEWATKRANPPRPYVVESEMFDQERGWMYAAREVARKLGPFGPKGDSQ